MSVEIEPPAGDLERWPASAAWRDIQLPPLPVRITPVIIAITPGETWCSRCGSDGFMPESDAINRNAGKHAATCIRCGSAKLVPAVAVLRPDEYRIAT